MHHPKLILKSIIGSIAGAILPVHVFAVTTVTADDWSWVDSVMGGVQSVITLLVPVLIAVAVVLFVWGMIVFMANTDSDQGRSSGKSKMIWGIIILFVTVSVWGFVELVSEITGIEGEEAIQGPQATF